MHEGMIIMGKKLAAGLFAGILGAGLYAAYQKLDEDKKDRLKRDARDKADELRDWAVDYAFYANDALSDLKTLFMMKWITPRKLSMMPSHNLLTRQRASKLIRPRMINLQTMIKTTLWLTRRMLFKIPTFPVQLTT